MKNNYCVLYSTLTPSNTSVTSDPILFRKTTPVNFERMQHPVYNYSTLTCRYGEKLNCHLDCLYAGHGLATTPSAEHKES